MTEFYYEDTSQFIRFSGFYTIEQARAQHTFLKLIEEEAPRVLHSLLNNVYPHIPEGIQKEAERHFLVDYVNYQWKVEVAMLQLKSDGSPYHIPLMKSTEELRDALVTWAENIGMNHPPKQAYDCSNSTFWFFQVACDTLSEWIKTEEKQLEWNLQYLPSKTQLFSVTQPFVFTHPMPVPTRLEDLNMLQAEMIEQFNSQLLLYLDNLESLHSGPKTFREVLGEPDKVAAERRYHSLNHLKMCVSKNFCFHNESFAYAIRQYLTPLTQLPFDKELPRGPVHLDPFIFTHPGVMLDTHQNMKPHIQNLVDQFSVARNNRLNTYKETIEQSKPVSNSAPLVLTFDGWNPLLEPDRMAVKKRLLTESKEQIENYLKEQEKQIGVAKRKAIEGPLTGYYSLLDLLIKKSPPLEEHEESVFRSMRPIARLLGITLRLDTGLSSIPALSDVFDNQNATLFIKHENNMISITWANQDDLAFLVQNGHDASRIKRIIGAMEELYFKGIVLQDVRWQEIFSLSRDKWKRIFDKLRSKAPFFIPQKTKEAINKPHRAVYAVQRFLIGEDLSTLLPRLWIDNATWNKYWMGFLSVGLGGDVDNFPEELVLGWKELWDNLDVNSSLLQELSQTLIPLLKNNIQSLENNLGKNMMAFPLISTSGNLVYFPYDPKKSLNLKVRELINFVRLNKFKIHLDELCVFFCCSPDELLIEDTFKDVLIQ